jgi:hypothetical protein
LATNERVGSPEGGVHRGAARLEGNDSEGRHPVVVVSGSRFWKVVGTQAVVGVTSMEREGSR